MRQANFAEANRLLEKAVASYRKQQQQHAAEFNPIKLVLALDSLGATKLNQGDPKTTISLFNEALQVAESANLQGREREIVALMKTDLGAALVFGAELEKGEALLRESLSEFRQVLTQPRWELGVTFTMLGVCALNKKQLADSEKFLLEGEKIYRQALGDKNTYLVFNLARQADVLAQQNNFGGAIKKARETLKISQETSPNNKLVWRNALKTLGDLLIADNQLAEGEDYLRQALVISEQETPPNLLYIARIKVGFSQSLVRQNRLIEAEKVAREAYDEIKLRFGEQNALLKPAANNLARNYEKEGKHDLAEKLK